MTPEQLAKSGTEHAEQVALFQWCAVAARYGICAANDPTFYKNDPVWHDEIERVAKDKVPLLSMLFAIKNVEKSNSAIRGGMAKAEGVKAGVPDLFLPVPRNTVSLHNEPIEPIYSGLFIELKRANGKLSDVSKEQREWIERLRAQCYRCEVCFGWQQARDILLDYLK